MENIVSRLAEVRQRIEAAATTDRTVTLVAVTKRFDAAIAAAAVEAGCMDLGENYAQELQAKAAELEANGVVPRWHMIGPVQRNKVKKIAGTVSLWHSVDRLSLAREIASRSPGARILVQVNFTGEDTKSGVAPAEVDPLVEESSALGLDVCGLMAMGPTDTTIDPRATFVACREAVDRLGLTECSTGMSGDFEVAVAEGSTMVRIGSAVFGARP